MNPESVENSRLQRLGTDRAARRPVGLFIGSSLIWLLFGSFIAAVASIKRHDPGFLAEKPWLTFGRVRPARLNAMAYGWLSTAGIGINPLFPGLRSGPHTVSMAVRQKQIRSGQIPGNHSEFCIEERLSCVPKMVILSMIISAS